MNLLCFKVKPWIIVAILSFMVIITGCGRGNSTEANTAVAKSNLTVEALNIGQGDALLIRTPSQVILMDTGDVHDRKHYRSKGDMEAGETGNDTSGGDIVNMLKARNITTIDKIIISHPHADHIGGTLAIFKHFKVKDVYDNGEISSSKIYRDYLKEIKRLQINYHQIYQGDKLDFGNGVTFTVFSPTKEMISRGNKSRDKQYNNNSIVGQLKDGNFTMLFTGDAEAPTEQMLVRQYGNKLHSIVLKSGHHGSNTGSSDEFLRAVLPEYVVISAGANNSYHHPHPSTIKRYQQMHLKIYATNGNGRYSGGDNGNTVVIEYNAANNTIKIHKIKEG